MTSADSGVARTKYRIPRPRRDGVLRPSLLARVRASVLGNPVTVVVAPAGYGKTTLLAQLAGTLGPDAQLAWLSLDEGDDDPGRFFASLVRALLPLELEFEEDIAALVANCACGGTRLRAAVGTLVNALCTSSAARLVLVLDDAHRLSHSALPQMIEALVERLPEHVSLLIAARAAPPLPVARWIVRGEAEEFGPTDLAFGVAETAALALAIRAAPLDEAGAGRLLARTHGWPAGIAMLLRSHRDADPFGESAVADAHLYDFLADEVLAALPAGLQKFVLDVAVLAELTPAACEVVSGRADCAELLRALYERDLFVVALDPVGPVLRFHDLFRDFLLSRLASDPRRLRELHGLAASAERSGERAMSHWIAAGDARAALQRLLEDADALLAEGGHAAVERWLERIPAEVAAQDPAWHFLAGVCAWRRWDWFRSREALQRAADALGDAPSRLRTRTLLYLMGARNALGDRDGARDLVALIAQLTLDDAERAAFALQRAWCHMGQGECAAVIEDLRAAVAIVARDPARFAPETADRAHSIYVGLPGALDAYRALLGLYESARGRSIAPWHGAPAIIEGWVRLWEGDRAGSAAAIERAHDVIRRFGNIPPLQDGLARLEAMFLAISGRAAEGVEIARGLVERFRTAQAAALRVAFEGAYVHGLARVAWAGADRAAFLAIADRASQPRRPEEWAFIDLAARTVPAQVALLQGDWDRAAAAFEAVVPQYAALRFPMGLADPRLGLAHARLRQGRLREALEILDLALAECRAEQSIGVLLLEPEWLVSPLLLALPGPRRAAAGALLAKLDAWRAAATAAARSAPLAPQTALPRAAGPLATLSDREREVLQKVADGAGNKEIARELDLSLHTVKRHVANILGKLDCVSRRQAAELLRRQMRPH